MDLTSLDQPEILEIVFPLVYSPFYRSAYSVPPPESQYAVDVAEGARIVCGFWTTTKESPTILYFHGNGETVSDYDSIASWYIQRGVNLFVVDYRGYGSSTGRPTISNLLSDVHPIFKGFGRAIEKEGFTGSIFVMGRSLGSIPAIELAFNYQDQLGGLIIESGTANNLRRLWGYLPAAQKHKLTGEDSPFLNKVKIRYVKIPTLIIHGECDQILPASEGQELYQNSGAENKRLLIIPGADHNDIMLVNKKLYFDNLEGFVRTLSLKRQN